MTRPVIVIVSAAIFIVAVIVATTRGGASYTPDEVLTAFEHQQYTLLAGHLVTLALTRGTRGHAGIAYGPRGGHGVAGTFRVVTLIACRRGEFSPNLGGPAGRATFWSGGITADAPRCVPLLIRVDNEAAPRRAVIHLGVTDCA